MALRLRRGTNAQRQTLTPVDGELLYTTDTKRLYVGDGTTIGGNSVSAPVTSVNGQVGTVVITTNEVSEGNGNLYFTPERAQDAAASMLTGGTNTGINFTYGSTQDTANRIDASLDSAYVTELAQDAVKTLLDNGSQVGISYTYNDASNSLSLTSTNSAFGVITVDPEVYIFSFTRGNGYTRHPTVTLSRGIGDTTGAFTNGNIVAYLTPNALESIEIVNGGSGYLAAPILTVVNDPYEDVGVTATATCTVSGGIINSVTVTFEGQYARTPLITVTPTNGGVGAVLRAKLFTTTVSRITVVTPGVNWTVAPIVNIISATGDTPSVVATAIGGLTRTLSASSATDELKFVAGSDKVTVLTSETLNKKKVTIDVRNVGEVAPAIQGSIPYYGVTGNTLMSARGLSYGITPGTLQIGSDIQNTEGGLRIIRNIYNALGFPLVTEQYHTTANAMTISLARGRGTQTTPLVVQAGDKLGSFTFSGHDGVRFVGSAQIAGRANAGATVVSGSNKLQTDLEFSTSNGTETAPTRSLTLYGLDKVSQFNGPVHLHRLTSTQRDALTGLGANTVGYMIYNTTTNKFQGWQNTGGATLQWVDLS